MKVFAIETSAKSVSAAITENGVPLASAYQNTGLTHSCTLLPMVDAMLHGAGLTLRDSDVFSVSAGPGSFTGLRIGISALKGLAWALDKPCVGVSTLEAMAQNLRHTDALIVCAMDARRSQVYNALFRAHGGTLTRLCEDRAIALDELTDDVRRADAPIFVVGDGAKLCYDHLVQQDIACTLAPPELQMQSAVGVALCAEAYAAQGKVVSAQELSPVYLRLSQAERERLARLKKEEQNQI